VSDDSQPPTANSQPPTANSQQPKPKTNYQQLTTAKRIILNK